MSAGISFFFILLLSLGSPNGLLKAPPRDLLSLVDAQAALQRMGVKAEDDAALIALLRAPTPDAGAEEPMDFAKRLLAIRALERRKSQAALPALKELSKVKDICLSDAATQAAAVIGGKPSPRPTGKDALKGLARLMPEKTGFVGFLDWERGSRDATLAELAAVLIKDLAQLGMPTEGGANPFNPQMLAGMEDQLVQVIGLVGNIRVDALMMTTPPDVGEEHGYFTVAVSGLYDPERLQKVIPTERDPATGAPVRTSVKGRTVLNLPDAETVQFCLVDAHTFIFISRNPKEKVADPLPEMLDRLDAPTGGRALPGVFARAVEQVMGKGKRLAIAGALSPEQKDALRKAMADEQAPGRPDQAARDWLSQSLLADSFLAYADAGQVAVEAMCPNAETAAALYETTTKTEAILRAAAKANFPPNPDPKAASALALLEKPFWTSSVQGNTVTCRFDDIAAKLGLFLGYSVSRDTRVIEGNR